MNDLTDLHDVLHDLERHAPDLHTVQTRIDLGLDRTNVHRRRFSRYAVPLVAAAAVVAVVSVAVALGSNHRGDPKKPAGRATAAAPGVRTPAVATTPAPDPVAAVSKPLSAEQMSWRFSMNPVAGYDLRRTYIGSAVQSASVTVHANNHYVASVEVYVPGALNPAELTGAPATVQGHAGYFGTFHSLPALSWQYADGAWAVVSGDFGWPKHAADYDLPGTRAMEQSIADAVVTTGSTPFLVDYTLGWLPLGVYVEGLNDMPYLAAGTADPGQRRFDLGDGKPGTPQADPNMTASALEITRTRGGSKDPAPNMTVGGHPAYYDQTDHPNRSLSVFYPDGTILIIGVDPNHRTTFSEAELVKIATNVSFAPNPAERATWVPAAQALPH